MSPPWHFPPIYEVPARPRREAGSAPCSPSCLAAAAARTGTQGAGPAAGRARPPGGSCSPGSSWSSSFGRPGSGAAESQSVGVKGREPTGLCVRAREYEAGGPPAQAAAAAAARSRAGSGEEEEAGEKDAWELGRASCTSPGEPSQVRQGALPRRGHDTGGRRSPTPRSAGARGHSAGGGAHPPRPGRAGTGATPDSERWGAEPPASAVTAPWAAFSLPICPKEQQSVWLGSSLLGSGSCRCHAVRAPGSPLWALSRPPPGPGRAPPAAASRRRAQLCARVCV